MSGSFLRRGLTVYSLPSIPNPEIFWPGLLQLCHDLKVWHLQIETYGSPAVAVPSLPGELERRTRWEYVLDLTAEDILGGISSHHRRNITRAAQAGLRLHRSRDASACAQHLGLLRASMLRRATRGELVSTERDNIRELALLASGSGELFQVIGGEKVLSSGLVLRASRGAYYQSAGTSPDGLKLGSSPFLVCQIAGILQQEGISLFNVGGTTVGNEGLRRFKAGFGTRKIGLEAASFCPNPHLSANFTALCGRVGQGSNNSSGTGGRGLENPSWAATDCLHALIGPGTQENRPCICFFWTEGTAVRGHSGPAIPISQRSP